MKQSKIASYISLLLLILISSCTKMDAYKAKYMAGGPIAYPGKLDSVKILSGKNRVMVTGLFTSDPKIVKYRVFWNSRQDSIEVMVKRTAGIDTASVIIPALPEGLMSFEIRTYDVEGNTSIPVFVAGNVYGDLYQATLVNRNVANAGLATNGAAVIYWADVVSDTTMKSIEIKYSNNLNVIVDTIVAAQSAGLVTYLPNYQQGSFFSYRAGYLPATKAIDAFYAPYSNSNNLYFVNSGNPFINASNAGRWGILAGWTTSKNVINHDNMTTGGWCADQGGCLSMEMGWGWTPPISNGKIYETIMLDPGTYTFSIVMGFNGSFDPVYIVAAAGNTLPDVAAVSTSLGYTGFQNLSFQFVNAKRQPVSLGFLANMTNGNQYWVVRSVNLVKN